MVAEHGWRSREHISECIDEQIVDRLEAKRADLADTEKSSASQDRNLLGTVEQIPDVLAPEMVEQLVNHLERQQPNKKPTLKTESWLLRRLVLSNSLKSNDGRSTVAVGERAQQGSILESFS